MSTEERSPATRRRRGRIWKIIIIGVLLAVIGEPLVMYRVLVLQKEKRQAAEIVVPAAVRSATE